MPPFFALGFPAAQAPPDWVPLLELTLANYALSRANIEPKDFKCTTKGKDHDNCNCWDKHGNAQDQDRNGDCHLPKDCWMYDAKTTGYFNYTKMPNSTASLHQSLGLWGVPSDMHASFDAAALVESATFASFHLDIKNKKGHFDAHVGTLRNYQGSFYVGYVAGSADGDLVQPYERHEKAIDAVGGADPDVVICQFFDMKKRGYSDDEIAEIQNGLQSYAYKKAASLVPQAAKGRQPTTAVEQARIGAAPVDDNEAVGLPTKRLSEAEFLAKWGHVVTRVDARAPASAASGGGSAVAAGQRVLQGGNPFALLLAAIQQITSTWQSIVNAFKSEYSEQIADKEFANGWSKFKQSTKVFKGAPTAVPQSPLSPLPSLPVPCPPATRPLTPRPRRRP